MRLRLVDSKATALRAIVAAGFIGAFLFAALLSAAPQLHERIHQSDGAAHQCAVTLLTAGNYEHTPCDTVTLAPPPPRPASAPFHRHFQSADPRLEFSLLEHAPPAIS